MARIDLATGALSDHVANAVSALKNGYVIVVPTETSYALMANAFSHDAVRALHVLRGDPLGVAAQVMIANTESVDGIAREISDETRSLMKEFWPGKLSLNLKPQRGLNWDLGDGAQLDYICVRIPESDFLRSLIAAHGPVVIASAALSGKAPIIDPGELLFSDMEVAMIFSAGLRPHGPLSTVVECDGANLRIVRAGAISLEQITVITPNISKE